MKLPGRIVAFLLPFALTGCFHRSHSSQTQPLAPPVTSQQAATPAPEPATPTPSTPVVTEQAKPAEAVPQQAEQTPAETPKPPVHRKKPVNHPTQQAAVPSSGVSAIGQLSSGNPGDYRRQTEDSIAAAERNLRAINRPLNDQEQRTVAHIRDFLKQARQALGSGDVDGAHTLTAKAKVLLAELSH
jgi:outer membrane biosynthesis protein TonB